MSAETERRGDEIDRFNAKLVKTYGWIADELQKGNIGQDLYASESASGDYFLFNVDYTAGVKNGVIGIFESITISALPGGASGGYQAFYFDTEKMCEITFDEYLDKIGVDHEKLNRVARNSLYTTGNDHLIVVAAAINDGEVIVAFNTDYDMNRYVTTFSCKFSDIKK